MSENTFNVIIPTSNHLAASILGNFEAMESIRRGTMFVQFGRNEHESPRQMCQVFVDNICGVVMSLQFHNDGLQAIIKPSGKYSDVLMNGLPLGYHIKPLMTLKGTHVIDVLYFVMNEHAPDKRYPSLSDTFPMQAFDIAESPDRAATIIKELLEKHSITGGSPFIGHFPLDAWLEHVNSRTSDNTRYFKSYMMLMHRIAVSIVEGAFVHRDMSSIDDLICTWIDHIVVDVRMPMVAIRHARAIGLFAQEFNLPKTAAKADM